MPLPEISELIPLLIMLLFIGAFAGLIAGLLGVGGGIVLVPSYFYAFGALGYDGPQLMQLCLGTSLATIILTSMNSVRSHHKKGAVDWNVLKRWGPGIVIGAFIGVVAASQMRSVALQAIFGGIGIVIGLYLAFGRPEWQLGSEMPGGARRATLSPGIGFLSALMGIGGGSFGVPLMTLFGMPIHRAVATASGFGLLIAVPSTIGFLFVEIDPAYRPPLTVGAVNLAAFGLTIAMTLLTTPLGVKLAHALNPKPLRRIFAIFITIVAANMLRKAMGF